MSFVIIPRRLISFRLPTIKLPGRGDKGIPSRKTFSDRRLVGWSQQQLFNLVSNVDEYQYFLPACVNSRIVERISDTILKGNLEIGIPPIISEVYTSTITLKPPSVVRAECREGKLFHDLSTEWKFTPGNQTRTTMVDFHVDFEFKSILYQQLAHTIFDSMAQQTMDAFMERAERLYGPPVPIDPSKVNNERKGNR